MSSEALAWAFRQDIKPSGLKFTLIAMCECANYRTGLIFASVAYLSEITAQDRKTIIANTAELEKRGYILDTGERTGRTHQVKIYRTANGTVPETEPSQKRNSSENPRKQSQKRDTEPSLEPSLPSETTSPSVERASKPPAKAKRAKKLPSPDLSLPEGWEPVLTPAAQAIVNEWPPGMFARERLAFESHAATHGRTAKDWQAAFRTWLINADRRRDENAARQPNARSGFASHRGADPRDGFTRALDREIFGDDYTPF